VTLKERLLGGNPTFLSLFYFSFLSLACNQDTLLVIVINFSLFSNEKGVLSLCEEIKRKRLRKFLQLSIR